ncbi:MAG: hypothetical protein LQ343_000131 [Gyalolechia ehrenbergii]|nr:MAG: hypothetical protein LQ343_000131 [Gyalolechia ehrenbergii]
MQTKRIQRATVAALYAFAVNSQDTSSHEPVLDAADIEDVVPIEILAPAAATSLAAAADSFIAAPQFSSLLSVLATGIPTTAPIAIQNAPTDFLLDLSRGSALPSWATALLPSAGQYLESVGQDATNIITSDFAGLYTSVSSQVAALETGAAASGGYVYPTGGCGNGNNTAPRPTASAAAPGSPPAPFDSSASSLRVGSIIACVVTIGMGAGVWLTV